MSDSLLELQLRHTMGALKLNVCFALTAPWTVLFGASGSGKTTMLRSIAGFVRPDAGHLVLSGATLMDTERGVFVPAYRRSVRSAGQAARLFPRLTVQENLEYGASASVVDQVVGLFRLNGLLRKKPEALSGGERQRISVAAAVSSAVTHQAGLLLLDEPFGGLDFALRDDLALELRDWLAARRVPVLSVTHDLGEAFLLEAEVVRIADGQVVAQGPVREVLQGERKSLLTQLGASGGNGPHTDKVPLSKH